MNPKDVDFSDGGLIECLLYSSPYFHGIYKNVLYSQYKGIPFHLYFEASSIAGCLLYCSNASFYPVAVVVLQLESRSSFYSDGLVYVKDFEPFVLEILLANYPIELRNQLAVDEPPQIETNYKLIMMLRDCRGKKGLLHRKEMLEIQSKCGAVLRSQKMA